jgi:hypothetical protein
VVLFFHCQPYPFDLFCFEQALLKAFSSIYYMSSLNLIFSLRFSCCFSFLCMFLACFASIWSSSTMHSCHSFEYIFSSHSYSNLKIIFNNKVNNTIELISFRGLTYFRPFLANTLTIPRVMQKTTKSAILSSVVFTL